ncbi:hypothetical protein GJ654_10385 [Rhodoblastus acidophilus]|uniref:Uncharacterized protein n=1 Tax=Rhodoblastus acidophilus TaxID=1074 RepID=A0A6N8DQE4_RHOAC|nr:hypothetical protein [Rhodoblastus acidophilus]MCW2275132.1 ribonucleoside-diphosphate reductase alpha chain [Rhodoblastus acidophilus]MTV31401.1 hypothetical protein [Rhodoblastus acidophilus]
MAQRREAETFDLQFDTLTAPFAVTVGRYEDGRVGEIFVNSHKRDQMFDHLARDTAILMSFALQHGATMESLRAALTRDANGNPLGLAGAVLDAIGEAA